MLCGVVVANISVIRNRYIFVEEKKKLNEIWYWTILRKLDEQFQFTLRLEYLNNHINTYRRSCAHVQSVSSFGSAYQK